MLSCFVFFVLFFWLRWMQGVLEMFAQDVEREMLASAPRAPRSPSPLAAAALAAAERPGEHCPWETGFCWHRYKYLLASVCIFKISQTSTNGQPSGCHCLLRGVTSQLHGTIGSQNWEDRKNKACEATDGIRNLAHRVRCIRTPHRLKSRMHGIQYLRIAR